jgi:cellulose biosynthesis protein BcsQ
MILANVAWILASNGKKVLVVDWDLDAPSLHRYFQPFLLDKDLTFTKGLIDFFNKFIDAALTPPDETEEDDENWYKPYANIQLYAVPLDWEFPQQGTIDFVPAGKQVKLYAMRMTSFDWDLFYECSYR